MVPDLMRAFNVSALALGSLSAFFYYPYLAMQIPVGSLVDRFGPQRLLTSAACLCGLSCIGFAMSSNIYLAELSRFCMGFSASFAFVGTLKLATLWFSAARLGVLAGLTQGLGMLGAAVGAGPMAVVVGHLGWRDTMMYIGFFLLVLAVLIRTFVKNKLPTAHFSDVAYSKPSILEGLSVVLKSKQGWVNAVYAGLVFAPTAAFAELWGVSFLVKTYNLSSSVAASGISCIFIGWALGGPLVGWISDRLQRRRIIMIVSALASLVLMALVIYVPNLPLIFLFLVLFLYGIANTGVAIAYAASGEIHSRSVAGVSIAFTNMASVIVGAMFQPVIGALLDYHWDGEMLGGIPNYSAQDFRFAMIALPVCLLLSCVIIYFFKESYGKGFEE